MSSRKRRKRRRAAEKRQAEETVKNKAEKANLENGKVVTTAIVNEVTYEVCEDSFYNKACETYESDDDSVDEISVEAEGEVDLNKDSLGNILEKVGIVLEDIKVEKDCKQKMKVHVKIKKMKRQMLEDTVFPLSVSGLKMEILHPG